MIKGGFTRNRFCSSLTGSVLAALALSSCGTGIETALTKPIQDLNPVTATFERATGHYNPLPPDVTVNFSTSTNMATVKSELFTLSGTCAGVTIAGVTTSSQSASVSLQGTAGCTNGQTVILTLDNSKVSSVVGLTGSGTTVGTYTFDTAIPTFTATISNASLPSSSANHSISLGTVPASFTIAFASDTDMRSVAAGDFTIGSNGGVDCTTFPSVTSVANNSETAISTINLNAGTCAIGQSFRITLAATSVNDKTLRGDTGVTNPNQAPATPFVVGVSMASSVALTAPGFTTTLANGTYNAVAGNIDIVAAFDQAVDVTGTPRLKLSAVAADGSNVYANYVSGHGTNQLTFRYTTAAGHNSAPALTAKLDVLAMELNGGTMVQHNTGGTGAAVAVNLGVPAAGAANSLSATKSIYIDTTRPTFVQASPSLGTAGTPSAISFSDRAQSVVIEMSEPLAAASVAAADLSVVAGTCSGGALPTVTGASLSAGNTTITFSLSANTCANGQGYSFTFDPASVSDVADNNGGGTANTGTGAVRQLNVTTWKLNPIISVGTPSKARSNAAGSVDYIVTYSNQTAISLAAGDITFNGAGGFTGCSASILAGADADHKIIRVTGCSNAQETINFSIAAGTASNPLGYSAPAVVQGSVNTFIADNYLDTNSTNSLPTVGSNSIWNTATNPAFTFTFAAPVGAGNDEVLVDQATLQSALSMSCGGVATGAGTWYTRTANNVITVTPVAPYTNMTVSGTACVISGAVTDTAGNSIANLNKTIHVSTVPTRTGTSLSGVKSIGAVGLNPGSITFGVAMNTATLSNITMDCGGAVALGAFTQVGSTNEYNLNVAAAGGNWVTGKTCNVTIPVSVTNSVGVPFAAADTTISFTTQP